MVSVVGHLEIIVIAILLDKVIGDPAWIPHPVILMGRWIHFWERKWNRPPYDAKPRQRLFLGACLTIMTVGLSWLIPFLVLYWIQHFVPLLAMVLNVVLVATTIAWKGLVDAGRKVYMALTEEGLPAARQQVGYIVGRDTKEMSPPEVVRATVETLAENIVDAIVSPVFFGLIGGAPLALAYRATNTLDSMVGYKRDRFRLFGRASARLDDVLNFVPARLTALLLWLAICRLRLRAREAWAALRRDARRHPSPNAGIPESLVAGALGVQLGGTNVYHGVVSHRATMGEKTRDLEEKDIPTTIRLVNQVSFSIVIILLLIIGGFEWWRAFLKL